MGVSAPTGARRTSRSAGTVVVVVVPAVVGGGVILVGAVMFVGAVGAMVPAMVAAGGRPPAAPGPRARAR